MVFFPSFFTSTYYTRTRVYVSIDCQCKWRSSGKNRDVKCNSAVASSHSRHLLFIRYAFSNWIVWAGKKDNCSMRVYAFVCILRNCVSATCLRVCACILFAATVARCNCCNCSFIAYARIHPLQQKCIPDFSQQLHWSGVEWSNVAWSGGRRTRMDGRSWSIALGCLIENPSILQPLYIFSVRKTTHTFLLKNYHRPISTLPAYAHWGICWWKNGNQKDEFRILWATVFSITFPLVNWYKNEIVFLLTDCHY